MMASSSYTEAAAFCRYILSSLDRLFECLKGLSEEELNWRPAAPNTNSLFALATHTLSNAEENILYTLHGKLSQRQREQEFQAHAQSADALLAYWQDARTQLQDAILQLATEDLLREMKHPRRGTITGLDILLIVARHAAEHLGQAELTRDLLHASLAQQRQEPHS